MCGFLSLPLCVCLYAQYFCAVFECVYMYMCVLRMPSALFLPVSLSFLQLVLPKHQQEESAGGKNKARKTLGMVNVKQIIKYGEKTTEKQPTVLRQHMLIRFGLLH